jgi:hypothetical protein
MWLFDSDGLSLIVFQKPFKPGERLVGCSFDLVCPLITSTPYVVFVPRVLVVVTVHTQKLPVTAIFGIVIVVVVAMMNSEFAQVLESELASTASANPWVQFQRFRPVVFLTLVALTPRVGDDTVELVGTARVVSFRHRLRMRRVEPDLQAKIGFISTA